MLTKSRAMATQSAIVVACSSSALASLDLDSTISVIVEGNALRGVVFSERNSSNR